MQAPWEKPFNSDEEDFQNTGSDSVMWFKWSSGAVIWDFEETIFQIISMSWWRNFQLKKLETTNSKQLNS